MAMLKRFYRNPPKLNTQFYKGIFSAIFIEAMLTGLIWLALVTV